MPNMSPLRKNVNTSILHLMSEPLWDFLITQYGFEESGEFEPLSLHRRGKR
jgi:hypothetical protein